jgi:hypothetical protein
MSATANDSRLIHDAVAREALAAGLQDVDDLYLPAFADAFDAASVRDGKVIGAAAVVEAMRREKPSKFVQLAPAATNWEGLDDAAFASGEDDLRERARGTTRPRPPLVEGVVNAETLTPAQFDQLEGKLRRPAAPSGFVTTPHRSHGGIY